MFDFAIAYATPRLLHFRCSCELAAVGTRRKTIVVAGLWCADHEDLTALRLTGAARMERARRTIAEGGDHADATIIPQGVSIGIPAGGNTTAKKTIAEGTRRDQLF